MQHLRKYKFPLKIDIFQTFSNDYTVLMSSGSLLM